MRALPTRAARPPRYSIFQICLVPTVRASHTCTTYGVVVRGRLAILELQPPHSTYYCIVLWKKCTMEGRQETQKSIRFWVRLILGSSREDPTDINYGSLLRTVTTP
jgi:hypothetical protein